MAKYTMYLARKYYSEEKIEEFLTEDFRLELSNKPETIKQYETTSFGDFAKLYIITTRNPKNAWLRGVREIFDEAPEQLATINHGALIVFNKTERSFAILFVRRCVGGGL